MGTGQWTQGAAQTPSGSTGFSRAGWALGGTKGTDQGSDGGRGVGSCLGPAQQHLPVSSCLSGQATRQGPSLQPQEPAHARSSEKGLAKEDAHSRPTALSPWCQSPDRAAAGTGTPAATGGCHRSQVGFVGITCVLASRQRGVFGQKMVAVVSSYRALGQGLRLG